MNKLVILLIAAALIYSVTALPPPLCICGNIYSPVCGSDGKTYENPCEFYCERDKTHSNMTIVKNTTCEVGTPCFCTLDFDPVCGSNGKTYPNKCTLECTQKFIPSLKIEHDGECQGGKVANLHECICTRKMDPVCGSDGVTYNNPCLLKCASLYKPNLSIKHTGFCDNNRV